MSFAGSILARAPRSTASEHDYIVSSHGTQPSFRHFCTRLSGLDPLTDLHQLLILQSLVRMVQIKIVSRRLGNLPPSQSPRLRLSLESSHHPPTRPHR